jgi:hypothetical protein
MFVTDTVDAILPPEGYTAAAIIDRLADLVGRRRKRQAQTSPSIARSTTADSLLSLSGATIGGRPKRRPMLCDVRAATVTTLDALEPFFSRVSMASYEAVYANADVDWAAVEASIEQDMFEVG